jgi:hypothetical protein
MIIPGQFGFNCPSGFREEAFWNIFPIGSNVKLMFLHRTNCFFFRTSWMIQALESLWFSFKLNYSKYIISFLIKFVLFLISNFYIISFLIKFDIFFISIFLLKSKYFTSFSLDFS